MADFGQIVTNFSNGISQNSKNWLPFSGRFLRNLAIFEDSDSVTLSPKPVKDSGSVVTDLVKGIVAGTPFDTQRYALGDTGRFYKISSGNVWSFYDNPGSYGTGIVMFNDWVYFADDATMYRYGQLTNNGSSGSYSFIPSANSTDLSQTGVGNTYTPPIAISESTANTLSFVPTKDPWSAIIFTTYTKGTGNWTVTIHDANNYAVNSVTVANASVNGIFTFTNQLRLTIGKTYHMHVTSTVADGTITCLTAGQLSTVGLTTTVANLVIDTNFHPMIQHTNGVGGTIVIGNEHYLAEWDESTFSQNKIVFEPGFKVRALMKINEYVAAFCWKGTNIDSYEYGRVYFWDGISNYWNFSRELTSGSPNAAITYKNRLFGVFGSSGNFELAPDESSPFRLIQNAPKLPTGQRVEVLPGAVGVWQNRVLFGYSNTDDTTAAAYNDPNAGNHSEGDTYTPPTGMEQGVYEFGNQSDRAITYTDVSTEVLSFPYQPSTTIANPLSFKIGCIAPFGKDLYISYKDGSSYYVDRVTKGNAPASFASWESLIQDKSFDKFKQFTQMPQKIKRGVRIVVTFQTLPSGATVTAKYRINRATAWTFGKTATAGATYCVANLGTLTGINFKELEYGFDTTAGSTNIIITGAGYYFDPLTSEDDSAFL